jgi:DNA-binding Xre family transcriptional regulator
MLACQSTSPLVVVWVQSSMVVVSVPCVALSFARQLLLVVYHYLYGNMLIIAMSSTMEKNVSRYRFVIRLKVREVAEKQGLNMSQLSRKADIQYNTIRDIWSRPERDISLSTLEKLSIALGVAIHELYEVLPDG